ncbi:MAG: hypothetical protein IH847_06030 [Acidobacteria bacterium]|nr:hypothetical protein [Acidobacteriota bacterium]
MKSPYLQGWFARLDNTFEKAQAAAKEDKELEAFLASYLVVLISGAYEECIEHLLGERAGKSRDEEVHNFIQVTLDRTFRNPRFDRIVLVLRAFSDSYAEELERKIDSKAREAINSIVTNRHAVSHGKKLTVTVTLRDVQDYHTRSLPIFEALEEILG